MAYINMNIANVKDISEANEEAWEIEEELSSAGNGKSVIIPAGCVQIAVTLEVTAGEGKVQASTSLLSDVKADTAVWVDWPSGNVTVNTQQASVPVTALRQVNVSGTTKIILRAQ
jgi:hypothetical protein